MENVLCLAVALTALVKIADPRNYHAGGDWAPFEGPGPQQIAEQAMLRIQNILGK